MRLLRRAALTAVLIALASAPAAQALPGLVLGFSGGADVALATTDPATQAFWVPRAQAVDAQMVRIDVSWSSVAPGRRPANFRASDPSSPGYDWTDVDQAVRDANAAGMRIMVDISIAPHWAEGRGKPRGAPAGTWKPSPTDLAEFATAIASRYDGAFPDPLHPGHTLPRVSVWQAWNEPNLNTYLTPQWVRTAAGLQPESPVIYRAMENAFYAAIKRVNPRNLVIEAGTSPYGDYPAGGQRMPPVTFDDALFCLNAKLERLPCPDPVHLDAIDHHPYGIGGPLWHALDPDDVAVPDMYKLTDALHAAQRDGTVLPRGPKGVWVTEISWDTKPPNPQGVPVLEEARWMEQSFWELWREGVSTILWWQIADSPPIPNYESTYQTGVYYLNGQPKPSATAFHFPFVSYRLNAGQIEAWGRAPQSGRVDIELRSGGEWRVVRRVNVVANQIFEAPIGLQGAGTLRAQLGSLTTLPWPQAA